MPSTETHQTSDKSQEADKPVGKARGRPKKLRYVDMTLPNQQLVPPCEYCKAHRYSIGFGTPSTARMFTPHNNQCPVPSRIFTTPEGLADYASRKAEFITHYQERLSRQR